MKQITRNIYVEENMVGCSLGLVTTSEGLLLIDSPMCPTEALKWKDTISQKGHVKYLINTEEHPDHWLGTGFLPGTLVSSEETRNKISRFPAEIAANIVKNNDLKGLPLMKDYKKRLADITFRDRLNLFVGEHTFKLFENQGHSVGGIRVFIPEEKVVFCSDIVFCRVLSWLQDSNPEQWLNSLEKIGELDVDFVVGGHGEVTDKSYLLEQTRIVQAWIDTIKSAINMGWSKEEALRRVTSPDPYPNEPGTYDTPETIIRGNITHLYDLYSKKP